MNAEIQHEMDAIASSILSASSEPRRGKKIDRMEPMATSNDGDDAHNDDPATPHLVDGAQVQRAMRHAAASRIHDHREAGDTRPRSIYLDDDTDDAPSDAAVGGLTFLNHTLPGAPQPDLPDSVGRHWIAAPATAAHWEMPFPLSDESDGEPEDKAPLFHDAYTTGLQK